MIFSKAFYVQNNKSQEVKVEFIPSTGVFWISVGDEGECSEIPLEDMRFILAEADEAEKMFAVESFTVGNRRLGA